MINKKDTVMIFEKYRNVLAEQQQNNNIQSPDDDGYDYTPFEYEGEKYTNPNWASQMRLASGELPRDLEDVEQKLSNSLHYFEYLLDYLKKNDPEDLYQMTKGIVDVIIKPSIKVISKFASANPSGGFGKAWDSK